MERVRFEYKILTVVRLTKEEVTRLSTACERHYDATVKSLSIPGPNAVLNAARCYLEDAQAAEIGMTHRQLDTLAKAVEDPTGGNFDLYIKFRELLLQSNDESSRLNRRD